MINWQINCLPRSGPGSLWVMTNMPKSNQKHWQQTGTGKRNALQRQITEANNIIISEFVLLSVVVAAGAAE